MIEEEGTARQGIRIPWVAPIAGVLLMIYVSATPGILMLEVALPGPLVHLVRGYGRSALLSVLLALLMLFGWRRLSARFIGVIAALFGAALIYVASDFARSGQNVDIVQIAKQAMYNKVISSYLIAVSMCGLLFMLDAIWGWRAALKTLIGLGTAFAAASLVITVVILTGAVSFGDYGMTNNNVQAYESVCILLLLLFLGNHLFSPSSSAAIAAIHGIVPVVHRSRGGMLAVLFVCAGYFLIAARRNGWRGLMGRPLERALVAVSLVMCLGISGVFRFETMFESAAKLDAAARHRQGEGMSQIARHLRRMLASAEYRHNLHSNSLISTDDDVVSAYSRIGTTLLALKAFASSPIVGIGIWNAYDNIEVADFGVHGLLPLVMAGYGMLGLIPLLIVFGVVAGGRGDSLVKTHVVATILVIAVFMNFYPPWLGVLLWGFGFTEAAKSLFDVHRVSELHTHAGLANEFGRTAQVHQFLHDEPRTEVEASDRLVAHGK